MGRARSRWAVLLGIAVLGVGCGGDDDDDIVDAAMNAPDAPAPDAPVIDAGAVDAAAVDAGAVDAAPADAALPVAGFIGAPCATEGSCTGHTASEARTRDRPGAGSSVDRSVALEVR